MYGRIPPNAENSQDGCFLYQYTQELSQRPYWGGNEIFQKAEGITKADGMTEGLEEQRC